MNQGKVRLIKTLVLRACFCSLIKALYLLHCWCPRESSWFLRLPEKVPDVGCCNQPLPEIQSLQEVSKYHKCVLRLKKQLGIHVYEEKWWKVLDCMEINKSWLWIQAVCETMMQCFLTAYLKCLIYFYL